MDMVHDDKPPRYGNVVAWVRLAGLEMLYVVVDDVRVFALVVGATCSPSSVCASDAVLCLLYALASATTTMLSGATAFVNVTVTEITRVAPVVLTIDCCTLVDPADSSV